MKIFHFDDIITREQALLRNLHFQVISLFYIDRYGYFLLKYVVINCIEKKITYIVHAALNQLSYITIA